MALNIVWERAFELVHSRELHRNIQKSYKLNIEALERLTELLEVSMNDDIADLTKRNDEILHTYRIYGRIFNYTFN